MRKAAMYLAVLGAALFSWAAPNAQAVDTKPNQPYVVLVGIDDYKDPQIQDRPHAEEDAISLYKLFTNKKYLGVDAAHVKLLLGNNEKIKGSETATRENILKAAKWATENAKTDDLVIFGLFIQGAPSGENACYLAADSTFEDRKKNGIASLEFEEIFNKLNSQRFVVFMDVNFNGLDLPKDKMPSLNLRSLYKEFLGAEDSKTDISRVVFLANNGLKPSLKLEDHGAFAKVLTDGLAGKADKFGYEADGLITVKELATYVRTEMPALLRKLGKDDDERSRLPIILEGQTHNFVIDHNPEVTAKVVEQLKSFEKIAKEAKLPSSVVEQGLDYLRRMPKLEAQQSLRKAYQKLAEGKIEVAAFNKAREEILESQKISDRDSRYYAQMVLRAIDMVRVGYVREVNEGTLVKWALEGVYKQINEKLPSAIEEKLNEPEKLSQLEILTVLMDARKHLGKREDLANGKDITYSLQPMLGKLDRHTDYIDPETIQTMLRDIQGQFSGIGVQIRRNTSKDALEVVTPLMGSPAYKAGMYTGDLITTIIREVDGKGNPLAKPEVISTKGMTTEDAVKKILGKAGTKVKLIVDREGVDQPIELELIRGNVEVESVLGHKRKDNDEWDFTIDPENKICYVRLTQFSRNTQRDLARVMKQLSKDGIKGFILDLRFNPGGLLDSAVKISDMYIEDGMIVTIKPRNGAETSYVGKSDGSFLEFPMVCLVNGYSASGSEIVSACLQDHGRAIVIGSRSYGKGSVQTIHPFATGGQLKMTTASFWRPNGKNLNKDSTKGRPEDVWGVKPDKGFKIDLSPKDLVQLQELLRFHEIIPRPGVERKDTEILKYEDQQLDMALNYLRGQIRIAAKAQDQSKGKGVVKN